jgi:hypothetical protein
MNDLEILREAWEAPAPPSPRARARARAALRPRPRRLALRIVAGVTAAAIAAAFALVVQNLGDAPPAVAVASALERAATAAERRPFIAPRDDQWIYTEDRFGDQTRRKWRRADGNGFAFIDDRGRLHVEDTTPRKGRGRPAVGPLASYKSLAALPTDPEALLRWAYRQAGNVTGAGLTEHGDVYAIFRGMLGDCVLPPELEAAVFRAIKRLPGVTQRRIEFHGRPAFAITLTEDWLRQELMLDAETFAYLGQRSTTVRDVTLDPAKAGNATGRVPKGHRVVVERVRTAIVDAPGRR